MKAGNFFRAMAKSVMSMFSRGRTGGTNSGNALAPSSPERTIRKQERQSMRRHRGWFTSGQGMGVMERIYRARTKVEGYTLLNIAKGFTRISPDTMRKCHKAYAQTFPA